MNATLQTTVPISRCPRSYRKGTAGCRSRFPRVKADVTTSLTMRLLLFCTFVLVVADGANVTQCNRYAQGCTVSNKISNFQGRFTSACELYNLCNSCAARYGISRKVCEVAFKANMRKTCGRNIFCRMAVGLNYAWVRLFGRANYQKNPQKYCSEPWVRPCLP